MYGQHHSIEHIQESSKVSQGYASSERCRFVGGVSETSIEYQLYFWILKSYQHGTRIGRERDSRPKHITAWTKNAAEKFCMCLRSFACMRLRLRASMCVCVHLRPSASVCVHQRECVCTQKIKRPDASRHKKILCPDVSFVQGLSGCTILCTLLKACLSLCLHLTVQALL